MYDGDRPSADGQRVAVALLDGVGQVAVLDPAAVDGDGDVVSVGSVQVGVADIAGYVDVFGFEEDGQHPGGGVVAHDAEDGFVEFAGAVGAEVLVAVVDELEPDAWVRHCVACHDALNLGGFGGLGAEELQAGGLVAEDVLDGDAGAGGAGNTGEGGDGGDGGECFTSETEGGDVAQVIGGAELGCCMP